MERRLDHMAGQAAAAHARRSALRAAFQAWRGSIESKWRSRVERACQVFAGHVWMLMWQARAQEVCEALSRDHAGRVAAVCRAQMCT
jgi:hypothetical protein